MVDTDATPTQNLIAASNRLESSLLKLLVPVLTLATTGAWTTWLRQPTTCFITRTRITGPQICRPPLLHIMQTVPGTGKHLPTS
jgi:hypothetical protein